MSTARRLSNDDRGELVIANRYRVLEELCKNTQSKIYLVEDTKTEEM